MAGDTAIISGMATRYATALFQLARDNNQLDKVQADLKGFQGLLRESDDLARMVESPVFSLEDQEGAISAIIKKAEYSTMTENFFSVVARNRRLANINEIIEGFMALLSEHRGEVTAVATSAVALNEEQQTALRSTLKEIAGQDIELISKVDPSILGGLIVKIGSRQIDDSLRTKLNNMKTRMKEVS